jgi:hypothetical protein
LNLCQGLAAAFLFLLHSLDQLLAQAAACVLLLVERSFQLSALVEQLLLLAGQLVTGLAQLRAAALQFRLQAFDTVYQVLLKG